MRTALSRCDGDLKRIDENLEILHTVNNRRNFHDYTEENARLLLQLCVPVREGLVQLVEFFQFERDDCGEGIESNELRRVCVYGFLSYWHNPTIPKFTEVLGPFAMFLKVRLLESPRGVNVHVHFDQLQRARRIMYDITVLNNLLTRIREEKG